MVLLAELAILAGFVLSALYVGKAAVQWAARRRHQRALKNARWSTDVHSVTGMIVVSVEHPTEKPVHVATLDPSGEDFDLAFEEAEIRANNTAKALNRAEARQK